LEKYTEQEEIRRTSLKKIIELGINPYPAEEFKINTNSKEIKTQFSEKENMFKNTIGAGRIMGKASFVELKDFEGRIQVYLNRDELCPGEDKTLYNDVFKKYLDIGDIIGVEGSVFVTKVGEISIRAKKIKILSKSIKPLPVVKTRT
jgi:lysyl-tRNA synthetase class 2